jgi:hypothetical protein
MFVFIPKVGVEDRLYIPKYIPVLVAVYSTAAGSDNAAT